MKPWMIVSLSLALLVFLTAALASGPVAVIFMLERPAAATSGTGSAVSLDQAATLSDVQLERLALEVRGQYLDDRAESISWWLMAAAVALAFVTVFTTGLGIIIVIAGFVGYQWFKDTFDDARRYTGDAQRSAAQAQQVADNAALTAKEAERLAGEASALVEQIKETGEQAQQELEKLRNSTAEDAAASGELQDLVDRVDTISGLSPSDLTTAEAVRLQRSGQMLAAIEKWQAIAIIMEGIDDERAARAWFSVGYLHTQTKEKDYESAVSAFEKAIALRPAFVPAYNNLGVVKSELGQDVEAIKYYDMALDLDSTYSEAYTNRGASKFTLGQWTEAREDYVLSISHNRESAVAYCNLGEVEIELDQYESAVENCSQAIRRNTELGDAYYHRGRAQAALNRTAEARLDFARASELAEQQGNTGLKKEAERALADLNASG